ncbi:ABC-2 transporter permease [Arachnia propionica]|nr:ABC-2 transporter permease [Arachnia propionica]RPA17826.1 ABC-2 transporter permease [Arachnia propionica]
MRRHHHLHPQGQDPRQHDLGGVHRRLPKRQRRIRSNRRRRSRTPDRLPGTRRPVGGADPRRERPHRRGQRPPGGRGRPRIHHDPPRAEVTTAVKNLLLKELKLANLVLPVVMGSLCLLMLIPTYPLYVGLMYMCLAVFFTVMHFREANDVYFSMLLPIRKRDAVRARVLLCCLFEIAQLVVAIPVAVLRNVLYESNPAGIEANPALFGSALIMFTIFNFLLLTIHYKTAHNIGAPFVVAGVAVLLYISLAEVLIHIVPFLRTHLDVVGEHVGTQLIVLAIGATVFVAGNILTYRVAAARFERVDL